jgi:hypothetical protein
MWILGLSLGQDFADEVDRLLDRERMPLLLSLNGDGRADHLVGRRDVQQEGLLLQAWHKHGSIGEQCFDLIEGLLGLGGPGEVLGFLKEAIQGRTLLAEA